jgi:hypothetical protein
MNDIVAGSRGDGAVLDEAAEANEFRVLITCLKIGWYKASNFTLWGSKLCNMVAMYQPTLLV